MFAIMNAILPVGDAAPPPTFVVDSLHLGWPAGPIMGLALSAAVVFGFFWLKRHVRWWIAGLLALFFFGLANFGIYLYALNLRTAEKQELYRPLQKKMPVTSSKSSDPSP